MYPNIISNGIPVVCVHTMGSRLVLHPNLVEVIADSVERYMYQHCILHSVVLYMIHVPQVI